MDSCVFCQIWRGELPSTEVWRSRNVLGIVPLHPVVQGHVIFIPREHAVDFADMPSVTAAVVQDAANYAKGIGAANLIASRGEEATQSVFHLHVHIVPRRENDGLALPWHSGRRRGRHLFG